MSFSHPRQLLCTLPTRPRATCGVRYQRSTSRSRSPYYSVCYSPLTPFALLHSQEDWTDVEYAREKKNWYVISKALAEKYVSPPCNTA